MAKSRAQKEATVNLLTSMLKEARGVVFADFTGLTVAEMQELRKNFRAEKIEFEVVPKTILDRALKAVGLSSVTPKAWQGSVSVATSQTDEISPAKVVAAFAKAHDKLKVHGGVLNKSWADMAQVKVLSKLPSKQELLGQLVSVMSGSMRGLVTVLQGNIRGLVQVLNAMAKSVKS